MTSNLIFTIFRMTKCPMITITMAEAKTIRPSSSSAIPLR